MNMSTVLFRDSQVCASTMTELNGINRDLVYNVDNDEEIQIPTYDREVQAIPEKVETQEQIICTDMTINVMNHMESELMELKDKNFTLEKENSYLHDLESERQSELSAKLSQAKSAK